MSFLYWFRRGPTSSSRRAPRRRPAPRVPALEVLEDRSLPSLFGPPTSFAVGLTPYSVAVGDFNGDGKPDLATANFGGGTVSVLLGNGNGTFGPATDFKVGSNPFSIAVGDFNGDGIPDLAVANNGSNTVSVLLGNGNGTLRPATDFKVGSNPFSIAVGDFNGDGTPDLAVANRDDNNVSVLLGNGDGSFSPGQSVPAGRAPLSVAVGDFNRDGIPDLAVANGFDNNVSVLLGNGDGTFQAATNYAVGVQPFSIAVGDFNGDGTPDLAVSNGVSGTVSVLLGNGNGTFRPATDFSAGSGPASAGTGPIAVAVGDFNRDGAPDLATANYGSSTGSVLLGDGRGGFGKPTNFSARLQPSSVAVGDFNGDGALDLAVAENFSDGGPNTVGVLLNQAPVTTTVVTAAPAAPVVGQLTTFTATVTATQPGQQLAPTGVVIFRDGATVLGSGTLDDAGQASFSILAAGTGYHAITAVYQGDPYFTGSTAPLLHQLVNQDATSTLLTASAGPALAGQPVTPTSLQPLTLTAVVSPAFPSAGTPTGTVLFLDNLPNSDGVPEPSAVLGTGTLTGGVATLTTGALAPGSHSLSAVYAGDDNFTGSTAALLDETVNNPAPVLRGLDTTALPEGSAGFTLTLSGTGFLGNSVVRWNGTPLAATAASSTQIQVLVPAAVLADEGTALVTVSNPGPGGGASLPQTFTVTDAALAARGANLSVHGNKSFSGVVATFADANPGATAADFTALITWDNGAAGFGTVAGTGPGNTTGPFTVTGTHTFGSFANAHTVSVTLFDKGGRSVTVTDNVIDPPAPGGPPSAPAGGNPTAAALPAADPPVVPPPHPRRPGHHRRPTEGHGRRHHGGHGREHPMRHHDEPFAP